VRELPAKERIIVALDVSNVDEAKSIVNSLKGEVGAFKVGLEAMSLGIAHEIAVWVMNQGEKIFWDGKWSDLPNTLKGAAVGLKNRFGKMPWAVSVHANCGQKAIAEVVANRGDSLVLAVTALTSLKDTDCEKIYDCDALKAVLRLLKVAIEAGVQGIICSPQEASLIKLNLKAVGVNVLLITPGIRPLGSEVGDQARPATPKEAIMWGSDFLVIGRPITRAKDRVKAARIITSEIEMALLERSM